MTEKLMDDAQARHAQGGAAPDRPASPSRPPRRRRGGHPPARLLARHQRRHYCRRHARPRALRPRHLQPTTASRCCAARPRCCSAAARPAASSTRCSKQPVPGRRERGDLHRRHAAATTAAHRRLQHQAPARRRPCASTRWGPTPTTTAATIDKQRHRADLPLGHRHATTSSTSAVYYLHNNNGINYGLPCAARERARRPGAKPSDPGLDPTAYYGPPATTAPAARATSTLELHAPLRRRRRAQDRSCASGTLRPRPAASTIRFCVRATAATGAHRSGARRRADPETVGPSTAADARHATTRSRT